MSKFPDSVSVPQAAPHKSHKFYTQRHVTTHGFMKPRPVFCREVVPDRDMSVTSKSFIRANPMPVPIFGKCKVFNRAFFVPFRTIFPMWSEFITDTVFNNGSISQIPPSVPLIGNEEFILLFTDSQYSIQVTDSTAIANGQYDFSVATSATPPVVTYYTFTEKGMDFFTIIESLGYKVNFNLADQYEHSALPLLAYAKIMMDWYYPSAYVGDSNYNAVATLCNYNISVANLASTDVEACLNLCRYCTYDNDYFVNAWDFPVRPSVERSLILPDATNNASSARQLVSNDPSNYSGGPSNAYRPNNGTPFVGGSTTPGSTSAVSVLTQYVVDSLRSMTDFTLRHRIAGVRALDRYLLEYGVNLSDEILKRSMYLGKQEFEVEFYDVFSHADTVDASGNGARLGDYAGKGTGASTNVFNYSNGKEFGLFIIVNSIIPVVDYYQGQNKETMHTSALDFWHPDFDHMFVQPIGVREMYVPFEGALSSADAAYINSKIFGYTSKYIEYNKPFSCQSGLFRVRTRNGLLPCYTLMRDLSRFDTLGMTAEVHNKGFVVGSDANQYNRIFYVDSSTVMEDQFLAVHQFEVSNNDSTLQPYETYEFKHDNYERKEMQVNGSKLN